MAVVISVEAEDSEEVAVDLAVEAVAVNYNNIHLNKIQFMFSIF